MCINKKNFFYKEKHATILKVLLLSLGIALFAFFILPWVVDYYSLFLRNMASETKYPLSITFVADNNINQDSVNTYTADGYVIVPTDKVHAVIEMWGNISIPFIAVVVPVVALFTPFFEMSRRERKEKKSKRYSLIEKLFYVGKKVDVTQENYAAILRVADSDAEDCLFSFGLNLCIEPSVCFPGRGAYIESAEMLFQRTNHRTGIRSRASTYCSNAISFGRDIAFTLVISDNNQCQEAKEFVLGTRTDMVCVLELVVVIDDWYSDLFKSNIRITIDKRLLSQKYTFSISEIGNMSMEEGKA